MPLSPQSEKELGTEPPPSAILVREQLRRLLAHPLFTNSKRYPVLLAYTVEQALDGNASELKERTIGVEAFGREPNYDVNLDPVVRTTAAEVRKRLIQYYYNSDHAGELLIEMPVGSYVPSFRQPTTSQTGSAAESVSGGDAVASGIGQADAARRPAGRGIRNWILIGIALFCAALIGFGVGHVNFSRQPSSLERFWQPITASSSRITYCLGEPRDSTDNERLLAPGTPLYGGLDVSDVITLARSIGPLVPGNGSFRIVAASSTEFTQLREGPFVLIGAYDNIWTMRVTQDLPFGFEYDDKGARRIVDRKSAPNRSWSLRWEVPPRQTCAGLCDHRQNSRQSDRARGHRVGRHPGSRDRSSRRGRVQSRVPECDARKGPEELEPDESGSRDRNARYRRPSRPSNGHCSRDLVDPDSQAARIILPSAGLSFAPYLPAGPQVTSVRRG